MKMSMIGVIMPCASLRSLQAAPIAMNAAPNIRIAMIR